MNDKIDEISKGFYEAHEEAGDVSVETDVAEQQRSRRERRLAGWDEDKGRNVRPPVEPPGPEEPPVEPPGPDRPPVKPPQPGEPPVEPPGPEPPPVEPPGKPGPPGKLGIPERNARSIICSE